MPELKQVAWRDFADALSALGLEGAFTEVRITLDGGVTRVWGKEQVKTDVAIPHLDQDNQVVGYHTEDKLVIDELTNEVVTAWRQVAVVQRPE